MLNRTVQLARRPDSSGSSQPAAEIAETEKLLAEMTRELADVTIVAREGRWKIAAIDVLDEVRLDDGQKVR